MPNYKLVSAVFVALTVVFGSIAAYDSILGTGAPKTIATGSATVTTTLVSTQEVVSTTTSVQTVTSPVGQCVETYRACPWAAPFSTTRRRQPSPCWSCRA